MVRGVFPGLTGERLGLRNGDVITSLNGRQIEQVDDLIAAASGLRAADKVELTVRRSGKPIHVKGEAQPQPRETYPGATVDYGAIPFRGGFVRDILIMPKGQPNAPVVFLLPGFSCASIEPSDPTHPYKLIGQELLKAGIGYYRAEKPGLGDSVGPVKCEDIDYATELDAFRAAYHHLIGQRHVPPERIFMFGHSLGGLEGPMLAAELPPRGLAVYGTVARNWADYHHNLTRLQPYLIAGEDPAEVAKRSEVLRPLIDAFYFERKSPAEIAHEHPDMANDLREVLAWDGKDNALGRSYHYSQDLAQQPLMSAWRDSKTNVLSLYGESDLVALTDADAKLIADVVNHYRPGTAKYVEVAGTNHPMLLVGSRAEVRKAGAAGKELGGKFNPAIVDLLASWIRESMAKPPVAQR
jgi:pimeloyl-ACP methyl ester carboxylesterase